MTRPAASLSLCALAACSFPHRFVPPPPDAGPPPDAPSVADTGDGLDGPTSCAPGASNAYTVVVLGNGYAGAVDGLVVSGQDSRGSDAVWIVDATLSTVDQLELPMSENGPLEVSGSIVVGTTQQLAPAAWTLSNGQVSMPQPLPVPGTAFANTVGVSGNSIVGWATSTSTAAELWSVGGSGITGPTVLPPLPGFTNGSAVAIAGNLVVGESFSTTSPTPALTAWKLPAATPAAIPMGSQPPGSLTIIAVSSTAIVGTSATGNTSVAVVWPIATNGTIGGPVLLGMYPGDFSAIATGSVGSAVIGVSTYNSGNTSCERLVRWTPGSGASWTAEDVTPYGFLLQTGNAAVDAEGHVAISAAFGSPSPFVLPDAMLLVPAGP